MHDDSLLGAYQLHSSLNAPGHHVPGDDQNLTEEEANSLQPVRCCVTSWLHNVILPRGFFSLLPGPSRITYYITKDTLRSPLREEKSWDTTILALSESRNTISAFSDLIACLDQAYIHQAFIVKIPANRAPERQTGSCSKSLLDIQNNESSCLHIPPSHLVA